MANYICVGFGRRLQYVRKKKGIKQIELSEHTGIARSCISKLENGRVEICHRCIEELGIALEMKPWELMRRHKTGPEN